MFIVLNGSVYSYLFVETDNEYPGSPTKESRLQEDGIIDNEDQSDEAEIEADSEASDTDEENDLGVNYQSSVEAATRARFVCMMSH